MASMCLGYFLHDRRLQFPVHSEHTLTEYVEIRLTYQEKGNPAHAQTEWLEALLPYFDRDYLGNTIMRQIVQELPVVFQ